MKSSLKSCLLRAISAGMAVLFIFLAGCQNNARVGEEDILTQKETDGKRIPITVLVKYAFSINGFEKAVEEKFPDIDIIQVGNFTRDMGISEYASRLEHDDLTDIVMTWPLDVGQEYWSDRLMDLSGFDFTSRYNLSMLNDISKDAKLYYLPGPAQVRGIVYNKTLFNENGWKVPKDFDEFVRLCQTIEESGIRSLQLGFKNAEVLDTAFIGYSLSDCFSKPQDSQWIKDYNSGVGNFGEHFTPALNTFQSLIDKDVLKKSDLNISYAERETMLFTRKCAMIEDSVLLARMGEARTGITDEFALMPFFNPGGEDWARLYMVCYIGLNKHLTESKNKQKYDAVIKLMDYISTVEGQEALISDTGAMFSSLVGTSTPDIPEISDLLPALQNGRYAVFSPLKNAQSALQEGLRGMLNGNMTKEDVIKLVDSQNKASETDIKSAKLGTSTSDFTTIETGSFITDAMRAESGCQLSLFLDNGKDGKYNGKGVSARLYKGDVTEADIDRILPDMKYGETGTLWKVEMSGEDLIKTLENSITVDNNIGGWFYYFSGLRMEYNPSAEPGNRIRKITTSDGKAIDKKKIYSIAVMDETIPDEYIKSCEKTEKTIAEILKNTISQQKSISPSKDGRFVVAK